MVDIYNGHTDVYGIIGNPIEHSFSPILQNTVASAMSENASYLPFRVDNDNVEAAIKGAYALGIRGLNITVPYKKTVMNYLCDIDDTAKTIGAVNTLKWTENGYVGYNTDILGFGKSCDINGIRIKDKKVMLLGAGGAANAVSILTANRDAEKIIIVNRTKEKAEKLKKLVLSTGYSGEIKVIGYSDIKNNAADILINATSVGMGKDRDNSPLDGYVDTDFLNNVSYCIDVIYIPWETKFLRYAKECGCKTVNGFDMLIFQGIASFEIWHERHIENSTAKELRDSLAKYFIEVSGGQC
ncbi:MAG: shikimate dehydrogenase [Clostridia bacterium]|nr:shikimate dehydrogenase [Clostridia bacterium]